MTTTPRQHPSWLFRIIEVSVAPSTPSATRKAAALIRAEGTPSARARQARRLAVASHQIFKLFDAVHTVDEIAAIVSRRPDSIRKFAAKHGVFISRSRLAGRRAVLLSREREDALRRLADDYGTQATEAQADLLTFSLDEDATLARRVLHVNSASGGMKRPIAWHSHARRMRAQGHDPRRIAAELGRSLLAVRFVLGPMGRPPAGHNPKPASPPASRPPGRLKRRDTNFVEPHPLASLGHSRRACAHRGGGCVRDRRNRQGRPLEADHALEAGKARVPKAMDGSGCDGE